MLSTDEIREIRNRVLERLEKPHIWGKMSTCRDGRKAEVCIQDLKEKRYDKAVSFLQNHYLTSEHLCKTVNLTSCPTSSSHFLYLMLTWIRDGISLEAVVAREVESEYETHSETESGAAASKTGRSEESEQDIVGLLVCRVAYRLEHSRTYSRIRIPGIEMDQQPQKGRSRKKLSLTQSETATETNTSHDEAKHEKTKLDRILKFRCHLAQLVDIYKCYDVDKFLQIYVICIHCDWKGTEIGELLVTAALQQATQLNLTVAMGMFTSCYEQQIVMKLGMKELAHLSYKEWNEGSFADDHSPESNAALIMAMIIEANFPKTNTKT